MADVGDEVFGDWRIKECLDDGFQFLEVRGLGGRGDGDRGDFRSGPAGAGGCGFGAAAEDPAEGENGEDGGEAGDDGPAQPGGGFLFVGEGFVEFLGAFPGAAAAAGFGEGDDERRGGRVGLGQAEHAAAAGADDALAIVMAGDTEDLPAFRAHEGVPTPAGMT